MATNIFDTLPAELRVQILRQVTDFTSLRALVLASPSFHAVYVRAREEVLRHVALQQLDYRLRVDALAAVRSAQLPECHLNEPQEVIAFLDQYRRARGAATQSNSELQDWASFSKECSNLQEAIALIRLHKNVEYVAKDYCLAVQKRQINCSSLSRMERLRLHRAVYRFQVYCNLFGSRIPYIAGCSKMQRREQLRAAQLFLPAFPSWEIQEVACVCEYLARRWELLLKEISVIVSPESEYSNDSDWEDAISYLRYDDALSEAAQKDNVVMFMAFTELRDHLAHLGPGFIAETLAQTPLEARRDLAKRYPSGPIWTFVDVYQTSLDIPYNLLYPAEKYDDAGVPAKFSLMSEAEQPSRGWKWFCYTYRIRSLGFGPQVDASEESSMHCGQDELSRGYPFWDEKRLEEWGIIISSAKKKKKKWTVRRDHLLPTTVYMRTLSTDR